MMPSLIADETRVTMSSGECVARGENTSKLGQVLEVA